VRYLILSDIHSNQHALDAALEDAASEGYDQVLVLGDLVGYGADPGSVMDSVFALEPAAMIRGNHDKVCAGLEPATLFNDVARQSAEWTAEILPATQRLSLAALPQGPKLVSEELEICHGSPFDEDFYIFDGSDAARALESMSGRICLFGHTHLPALFATVGDPVTPDEATPELVRLPKTGPALINVGSVGQPRDGDPRAAYGLLDAAEGTLKLRRVAYDIAGAQEKIRQAGLPAWLGDRLAKGQ
jgi:diadenosine tetraphosphatase ApaH/serine/threonine PP2A family protein phosphatase